MKRDILTKDSDSSPLTEIKQNAKIVMYRKTVGGYM